MIKFKYTNEDKVSTTIETESMDRQELLEDFAKFMKAIGFKATALTSAMKKYIADNDEPITLGKPCIPNTPPSTKGIFDELYDKYNDKRIEKYRKAHPFTHTSTFQITGVDQSPKITATERDCSARDMYTFTGKPAYPGAEATR